MDVVKRGSVQVGRVFIPSVATVTFRSTSSVTLKIDASGQMPKIKD
jgi:hypothetical protein